MPGTLEAVVNQSFSTVVSSASGASNSDAKLFVGSAAYGGTAPVVALTPSSTTTWSVTFTPNVTGLYTFYCFGQVQFQVQVVAKSMYTTLKLLEDEALGSWTWDKTTGLLTLLGTTGATIATFTVLDSLVSGSRERLS